MKKLAILGKLPTKFKAPFNDNNYHIWGFNYHTDFNRIKHYTTWFDIHAKNPNPIADYTRQNFPFKECEELLGGQYFNNTVSYLIAFAILQGYKEIELYGMRFQGVECTRKQEYQNVRELIFFAKGKGVNITAPFDEVMLKQYPLYGV